MFANNRFRFLFFLRFLFSCIDNWSTATGCSSVGRKVSRTLALFESGHSGQTIFTASFGGKFISSALHHRFNIDIRWFVGCTIKVVRKGQFENFDCSSFAVVCDSTIGTHACMARCCHRFCSLLHLISGCFNFV